MAEKQLKGTKSHENLKAAFAGEAQANRRYLYFARLADSEGHPEVAELFRQVAQHETGHAFGHMRFLKEVGDPVTGVPIGSTRQNLTSGYEGETYEATQMYPGFAKVAREEGFEELAKWFESLVKVEQSHADLYARALEDLT
jgi:rubrerythrin